ncbi:MAG: hypothetical protein J3T61_12785 [Candidatus Brocadiales bacterium]|nr:hypothetical protein [Candidatus Bathyanammoxibius sp.]
MADKKPDPTELHCYMNPFQKWLNRWRLRRIIMALQGQVNQGNNELVIGFAKNLEATEIMSRGSKKHAEVIITVTRRELDSFIRYMCSLHDAKLSRIMIARIGLATLVTRDDKMLGQPAEVILTKEMARSNKPRSDVIGHAGKQLRLKI